DKHSFFASEETNFASLGLQTSLVDALQGAGYDRPSTVQELSAPPILSGRSLVLAAETGSGKTMAYLAPLISSILSGKAQEADVQSTSSEGAADGILVLCPNAALCSQVVAFADSLKGPSGAPLVRSAHISSAAPLPRDMPDIVAATPAGLMAATQEYGQYAGWHWTKAGIVTRIRHVVLDEADLLLTGGFQRDVRRILDALREGDRAQRSSAVARQLGVSGDALAALPRHLRKAAAQGVPAMHTCTVHHTPTDTLMRGCVGTRRTWKRQYLFVAATMPSGAGQTVAGDLGRLFPDLLWLSGPSLHEAQRRVAHTWLPITQDSWRSSLQARSLGEVGQGRTLVFAANVAAANEVATVLADVGLQPLLYHREVSPQDRAGALDAMRAGEGGVLVCTDAAARGIDIPDVTHVVQSSFAASAIDFLHRVGRTGRAGKVGRVTSLYMPNHAVLAEAIKAAVDAGEPVEGAFSRNRSFSKKVRK
ncbi:P-loop containing nucleoside triphosphate hydrolase protein, partial [Coccomyxa subellipsoidea C-169]